MAFIDITDPHERDKIVSDYIATVKNIHQKTEDEKAQGLHRNIELTKVFNPVIQATEQSATKITDEIKKNRSAEETKKELWKPGFAKSAVDYYLGLKSKDEYYGIQKAVRGYVMGNKNVAIDDQSNIVIDDVSYPATPGLWELIMLKDPQNFTPDDMSKYEDIVEQTQVIFHPLVKNKSDKPRSTLKYKNILKPMEAMYEDEEGGTSSGTGIQFLPGNISGLLDRLKLLYGEREAGNTVATNNEIVGILDELTRLQHISRAQNMLVAKSLGC